MLVSSIPTNQNIPDTHSQDVPDVLAEQMVKSKEKLLNTRERKLKELEKKLHLKEISLSDQIQQNDFSKAYIVTMENKVKELESSNRLMKMKLLSQMDASIDVPTTDPSLSNLPQQPTNVHQRHETPLQDRVVNLELKLLEHRIYQLEQSNQYNQSYNFPSDVSCHWSPYYVGSGYPVYYHGNYGRYNAYPYKCNIESAPYTKMYNPYPLTHMQSSSLQSDPRPLILTTTLTRSLMKQARLVTTETAERCQNNVIGERIPVHFSCRGRRKTARLKEPPASRRSVSSPNLHKEKENRQKLQKLDIPSKDHSYPAILLVNDSNTNKKSQRHQESQKHKAPRRLQIPKIVELEETEPSSQTPLRFH